MDCKLRHSAPTADVNASTSWASGCSQLTIRAESLGSGTRTGSTAASGLRRRDHQGDEYSPACCRRSIAAIARRSTPSKYRRSDRITLELSAHSTPSALKTDEAIQKLAAKAVMGITGAATSCAQGATTIEHVVDPMSTWKLVGIEHVASARTGPERLRDMHPDQRKNCWKVQSSYKFARTDTDGSTTAKDLDLPRR